MFHQPGEQMRMALRSIAPFVTKITVIVRQNFPAVDGVFTSTSTGFKQCLVNPLPFSKSREEFEILRNRFICVYPVQLEGTLAKTRCLHCRLARWNKGVSSWSGCNMPSQFVCP